MLVLYRSGRQADALDAYAQRARALVEEIGVEPGPELPPPAPAILRQDRALDRLGDAVARPPPETYVGGRAASRTPRPSPRGAWTRRRTRMRSAPGCESPRTLLAEKVVALQVARERSGAEHPPGGEVVVCPFMRLAAFESEDAAYFLRAPATRGRDGRAARDPRRLAIGLSPMGRVARPLSLLSNRAGLWQRRRRCRRLAADKHAGGLSRRGRADGPGIASVAGRIPETRRRRLAGEGRRVVASACRGVSESGSCAKAVAAAAGTAAQDAS